MSLMHRLASLLPIQTKASQVGKLLQPSYKTAWVNFSGPTWSSRSLAKLTREGFYRNVIAYRCVTIVSECAASTPFLLFRGDKRVQTHPLLDILKTPNPLQSGLSLMEAFYAHLQIGGNAYMEVVTSADGQADELYVLRPDRMSIKAGTGGWPSAYEYQVGNKKHCFPVDQKTGQADILHLRTFNPQDDYYGLSPLKPVAMSIDIHNAAAGWNKALLDNAARPSGALVFEPTDGNPSSLGDEQFKRLKQELEECYQGRINAGRPFLLEGGLKWRQMAFSPETMEFIETKNVAAREIALAFGVPPMILGIPDDNTYANYAEANRALWRLTLLPLLEQMCAGLNTWLTPRFGRDLRLDYDRDAIPALSFERDALWERIGEADFLTDNEKRKMTGFGQIKGGDQLPTPLAHPEMPRGALEAMPLSIDNIQTDGNALKKKALTFPLSEAGRLEQEPLVKIWRTVRDNRTRQSHIDAHGQVRFMGEPFTVGGVELSGPRDPDGPPGETFNCRCIKEVVPISQLPSDLLSQIEDRLTDEQSRFLDGGIRVADASGNDIPDGLFDEDNDVQVEANKVLKRLLDMNVFQADRIPSGVFGTAYRAQDKLKLLQEVEKELLALEERGFGGLAKDVVKIVPNVPEDETPSILGKTDKGRIAIRVDIDDEFFEAAKQRSAFKNETNQTKESLTAYTIRHEIAHALTPQGKEDLPKEFQKAGAGRKLNDILHNSFPNEDHTETFANALAWFTSPDYPHDDPDHPKRFPKVFEDALKEFIINNRQ